MLKAEKTYTSFEVIKMDFKYENGRIFKEDADGKLLAEVTFPESDGVADIDHTFVDPSLRGRGIAGELMVAAAEQIRKEGKKAKLTCPYAVNWFAKRPEYSDILI